MQNKKMTVTEEDLKDEDPKKWIEIPYDWLKNLKLSDFAGLKSEQILIAIERRKEDGSWPRAKGHDWRDTLSVGDIVDAKDKESVWYEAMIRYVYPKESNKYGKCAVHYIGWDAKWDEILDIKDTWRLARRHTCTTGPHIA